MRHHLPQSSTAACDGHKRASIDAVPAAAGGSSGGMPRVGLQVPCRSVTHICTPMIALTVRTVSRTAQSVSERSQRRGAGAGGAGLLSDRLNYSG